MAFLFVIRSVLFGFLVFASQVHARPVIINIDASSNNGFQMGTFIGTEVQKNVPDTAKQYDRYLSFLFSPSQFTRLVPQIEFLKSAIDENYRAEVEAIAAVWQLGTQDKLGDNQLSMNEFWLLQFLPDLTNINKGSAFAVMNRNSKNPIAARNVDWKNASDLTALQTINLYHYDDRTIVTIGFAGLIGVINGFNDQGLFVSLLDSSAEQLSNSISPVNSSSFDLRTALKQADKFAPASYFLAQKMYSRSHQILFADTTGIAVLEQPANTIGLLRKTDSPIVNEMSMPDSDWLIVVNCFVLKNSPHNCHNTTDYYHWERFKLLLKTFSTSELSVNDVIALMDDSANYRQAIFNKDTEQSLVFTPKNRTLYLYTKSDVSVDNKPLVEKYQFIPTHANSQDKIIDVGLLVLGVGILIAGWWYIFRGSKHKKTSLPK